MNCKGQLLLIGGAEDIGDEYAQQEREENRKFEEFEILKDVVNKASRDNRIEFITTGTRQPEAVRARYEEAFDKMGYSCPNFTYIEEKEEAHDKNILARIEKADVVFFTGGDQSRLAQILCGTPLTQLIKKRYEEDANFLIAGTSAGAMFLSALMIEEAPVTEALLKDTVKVAGGFGVVPFCIIDTHFIKRGRFGRLAQAVISNSEHLGIGLGEDTAISVKKGTEATCIGSGTVVTINGKFVKNTNLSKAREREPIFIENLVVNILVKGCRFSLEDGALLASEVR
ncbi:MULTISPECIES: cyanophycinase [Legionella]|uniref:Cyanophycinase n=1 Tax=Legionella septentrionalis TaxID=2498109 RepID=A0A433JI96_9GAMM|nr:MULTISPECIES: cyanophycinase [Legionella]MCP0914543.1 cyanophycinase [Legionella sp. 27cVA30]RUQ84984.1 cyanophycinase [Legionella septentrionalis]RUR02381.1 cyanophycinase [Legionella septentrionalis]RUR10324.1 cyanophycinase [Legionella septentrionalis]RUR17038.1 cyanophycinase [Legionella septentrionalis]